MHIITSQAEWDSLPDRFEHPTVICIQSAREIMIRIKMSRGNSSVEARENSSVVAQGNSSVVAWGNSSIVARGNSFTRLLSSKSRALVHGSAIILIQADGAMAERYSESAHIIQSPSTDDFSVQGWLEREGVVVIGGRVVLYKRVSASWLTQEGMPWETGWNIGTVLQHPAWEPSGKECGGGKYHACSRPYLCDEYRSGKGDRYVAISVSVDDLHAWPYPRYPHKIAFRASEVLYECDRYGRKMEAK